MIVKISRAFNEIFTIISYQNGQLSPCAQPPPLTLPSFATDASAVGRRLHALLMRARRIKCFCGGAKTLLFKGKSEAGNAPPATFQRNAAPAAHRTSPCVATDVCTRVRTLHALLMRARRIKCFCEGAKTMLFKGERDSRPCGLRRTAHVGRDAASAASPRATTQRTRSTPRRTAHLNLCVCCELHARDPRKRAMPETPE